MDFEQTINPGLQIDKYPILNINGRHSEVSGEGVLFYVTGFE